ncbi:hypothetical protein CDL12_28988 [Handroanthus impetiginosus]|uniref:Uncharacterized protein n=1 Tax=Handroanthus impetiginosus TaxID=429701 RepID=A0A2G9FZR2_9LAMI|nr:hypothetical protein CDL12_28988 [Handroanthus impetiginosus]
MISPHHTHKDFSIKQSHGTNVQNKQMMSYYNYAMNIHAYAQKCMHRSTSQQRKLPCNNNPNRRYFHLKCQKQNQQTSPSLQKKGYIQCFAENC